MYKCRWPHMLTMQLFISWRRATKATLHEHGLCATVRLIAYTDLSVSYCACCQNIQLESPSLLVSFSLMLQYGTQNGWAEVHVQCEHLIFPKYFNMLVWNLGQSKQIKKQASKHTHARVQCSHASVDLTQARPNNKSKQEHRQKPLLLQHVTTIEKKNCLGL